MNGIDSNQIKEVINNFLQAQLSKKLEPEKKRLAKAQAENNPSATHTARQKISDLKQQFSKKQWLEKAANSFAEQLKFGTHISKGIHPDSKGDNVNFQTNRQLPEGLVGSQSLPLSSLPLDANGNSAALPLAAFLNLPIDNPADPQTDIKLRDLIMAEHSALEAVFSDNPELSQYYLQQFKQALMGNSDLPRSDGRNKQLLWPCSEDAMISDNYKNLIPLHPSALLSVFRRKLNQLRYSPENTAGRKSRFSQTAKERQPYISINEIAYKNLGGTQPQNVSQLTSRDAGRNLLLLSVPPQIQEKRALRINKRSTSIFDKRLRAYLKSGLSELYQVVEAQKATAPIRDQRRRALDKILFELFTLAKAIHGQYDPGWSKDYNLNSAEQYWLDPKRAELEGEENFAEQREKADWLEDIARRFSQWLNRSLQDKFPDLKDQFADQEFDEWHKTIRNTIKASQRREEGIFL